MTTPAQRVLLVCLAASAALHLAAAALISAGGGPPEPPSERDDPFLLVDIDVAPPPPEAFEPEEDPEPDVEEAAGEEAEPAATVEEAPEPEAPPEPVPAPDAGALAANPDAGPPDAGALAANPDAGARDGGAAIAAAASDAGARHGGAAIAAAASDAGPGARAPGIHASIGGDGDGGDAPPGTTTDFRPYVPEGDVLAVLLRLDRLRDTPWAALLDEVLKPMPDHRMIIGERDRLVADLFDTLLISSSDPTDVSATNLAGKSAIPKRQLRSFLDHPRARIDWTASRGGALGRPRPSPVRHPEDDRVFLMPFGDWAVLSRPKHFGPRLLEGTSSPLREAKAAASELPEWLAKLEEAEAETGKEKDGPVMAAGFHGLGDEIEFSLGALTVELPAPERAAIALELGETTGFLVRGTLVFSDEERAAAFDRALQQERRVVLGSTTKRILLGTFHALNALKGLSTRRRGRVMSFATSISNRDARALLEAVAEVARSFYGRQKRASEP